MQRKSEIIKYKTGKKLISIGRCVLGKERDKKSEAPPPVSRRTKKGKVGAVRP